MTGKFDEAVEAYQALNQVVDLGHQVNVEYLGYIAYRQGRYDDAVRSLQTALAVVRKWRTEEPPEHKAGRGLHCARARGIQPGTV